MTKRAIFFLIAALISQSASAQERIRLIQYNPDQVEELPVSPGYAAIVELANDEAVDSIVVGNSIGWQVTPDSSGRRVVVKPTAGASTTNMIILTQARRYTFLLSANGSQTNDLFVVHFSYPNGQTSAQPAKVATYKLSGSKTLFPASMYDDGRYTTITWNNQTVLPAVFAVEDGKEGIVNGRMIGPNYVIEGVAPKYVLRLGDAQAIASRKTAKAKR
ncbi:TrbG/VirB9 family P-type conjugative transfer protein [Caenibius sp. WL]|uniref:TrbG/VirB9 family P-type conjugative transfer protein n=1 Tax=Caenibius sp. WL TaxID=2872646 RepID=UPI001C995F6B|nr:TrbG/VirB9 family P-type conjugative transfer protein [Caenibius sp. WL]QZP09144.1 TrbG/VirB9 family P-type conjugative transfer protein [Caenibius sp. WL]